MTNVYICVFSPIFFVTVLFPSVVAPRVFIGLNSVIFRIMGEKGKRSRQRDNDGDNKNHKRRASDKDDENGNDELVVYRILCPSGVIGSVIGKSGKVINSIRRETKAMVKVVDPFPGAKDRVITIYCYVKEKEEVEVDEEFNHLREPLCPAQDALLRVHDAIVIARAMDVDSDKKRKDKENDREKEDCQLLVPSSQSANIIGKAGVTIKRLRSKTKTNIKVSPKDASDPTHSCALDFDNFVSINGDPVAVKKALFAVSAIMYKFTAKEAIPLDTNVPVAPPPTIIIPSDVPIFSAGGLYPNMDMLSSRTLPPVIPADFSGYADTKSSWPIYSSAPPVVPGYGSSSQSEELVVRIVCPSDNIGRVIGKGGSSIKSVRHASGARIEVDDKKGGRDESLITVTSTESPEDLKSIAVEAVLLLQEKINDEDTGTVSIMLLIPSKVIGCIIGKSGSIINEIRKRTKAEVRISRGPKPRCSDANDEHVEVVGEVGSVRDALVQIVLRLRDDVLKDKEVSRSHAPEPVYAVASGHSLPPVMPSIPQIAPVGYERRPETGSSMGMLSSSGYYGYGSLQAAEHDYGSLSSYTSNIYERMPPPSSLDLEMIVPAHAVGKVMGKGGANLANIRKISGADVEMSESKTSRGDRIALISGTSEQKRAAENLIQAFILAT